MKECKQFLTVLQPGSKNKDGSKICGICKDDKLCQKILCKVLDHWKLFIICPVGVLVCEDHGKFRSGEKNRGLEPTRWRTRAWTLSEDIRWYWEAFWVIGSMSHWLTPNLAILSLAGKQDITRNKHFRNKRPEYPEHIMISNYLNKYSLQTPIHVPMRVISNRKSMQSRSRKIN